MSTVDTIALHGGYNPGNGEPRQVPIYQSTTWKYSTSEDMGKLFDLEASGYFYTRLQNPTNDYVLQSFALWKAVLQECSHAPARLLISLQYSISAKQAITS